VAGVFIAFEGIDGSGKSTVAAAVVRTLRERGLDVVSTREPGGTAAGREIRSLLLNSDHRLEPITEMLLMCADRAEHVATVIRPALESGAIVISDRFSGSTRAYQGFGLGIEMTVVDAAIRVATGGLEPDLTILFDLDPAIAYERKSGDAGQLNRIDVRDIDFRTRVRDGFLELARSCDGWRIIDASQSVDQVLAQVLDLVDSIAIPQYVPQ
jgi:dTMP kinase